MNDERVQAQPLTLTTSDGRSLSANFWAGIHAHERSVVILQGLAIPQRYMSSLAQFLADAGWGVMTFDYRGVGESRSQDPGVDKDITMDDWANLDLPAAIDAAREQAQAAFVGVFAHSLGGQLLGQSPAAARVDGALFISCQRGIPRFYSGRGWLAVRYAYTAFPLLIRVFGRIPVSKLTFPIPCPAPAVLQWIRWGKTGVFTDTQGNDIEDRFAAFTGPLVSVSVDDDSYAPPAAVDALAALYTAAKVQREHIRPDRFGIKQIGHLGVFHRRASDEFRGQLETWLRQMSADISASTENPENPENPEG